MNDERSCENCRHINKNSTEHPCVDCVHNAIDHFEPVKYIKVSKLIKLLQKMPNQQKGIPLHMEIGELVGE